MRVPFAIGRKELGLVQCDSQMINYSTYLKPDTCTVV